MVGVHEALPPLLDRLAGFQPKLVFNGCEAFRGRAHHEYGLAAVLEMHGYRYTGSSPTGLLVAQQKIAHEEDPRVPRHPCPCLRRVPPRREAEIGRAHV